MRILGDISIYPHRNGANNTDQGIVGPTKVNRRATHTLSGSPTLFSRKHQTNSQMSLINRVALTITRKQPYVDWANGTDGPVPIVTYPVEDRRTIYLAPNDGLQPDPAKLLDEFWEDVFESELSMWMEDESTWPQPRTRQLFDEWFDAEVVDTVIDLVPAEPLSEDDVEEADIEYVLNHCAWCDLELEPENRRMVGLPLPDRGALASREGLTVLIPTSDRVLVGIMTMTNSPAAIEGDDLMFVACSSRCEKIIRKEAARGRKRGRKLIRVP